jgi:hypothetical protein
MIDWQLKSSLNNEEYTAKASTSSAPDPRQSADQLITKKHDRQYR